MSLHTKPVKINEVITHYTYFQLILRKLFYSSFLRCQNDDDRFTFSGDFCELKKMRISSMIHLIIGASAGVCTALLVIIIAVSVLYYRRSLKKKKAGNKDFMYVKALKSNLRKIR